MRIDKPTGKDNPAFRLTLENNGCGLSIGCDGGAEDTSVGDLMSFRHQLPKENTNVSSLSNKLESPSSRSVAMLNIQQVPQHVTSSTPRILNPCENAFPQQMVRGIHQPTSTHSIASSFMNEGVSACRFPNPLASRNIVPMRDTAEVGYQMNRQCGEANSHTVARPQRNKRFASVRSRPVLHHPHSNTQMKADTDAKANMDQIGSLKKIDGIFPSLEPESTNARPLKYFSSREISSKLEEAASPNFSTSNATRNPSSLVKNVGVGFPNSQESGGGPSTPAIYVGGLSNRNEAGEFRIASTGLSSRPFHILHTPEVNMQPNMLSMPNDRISNSARYRDKKYGKIRGDQLALSGAYSSSPTAFPLSGENKMPSFASRSDNCTWTATGIAPYQLHNMESSQNLPLESILNTCLLRTGGSGVRHGYSGFSSVHEGSVDKAAVRNILLDNQFQTNNSRTAVGTSGVFPKRLGVQVYTAQAPKGSSISIDRGVQAASEYCKSLYDIPVRFCRDLHVSSANGQSPGMPVLPSANNGGPLTANGPPQSSIPIQNWTPMSTTGQGLPVAKVNEISHNCAVLSRPSLKRGAIQFPPDANRRKLTHNPTVPPSMSYKPIPPSMPYKPVRSMSVPPSMLCKSVPPPASLKRKNAPALLPTATAAHPPIPALSHIKWQGIDEQPEPTGDKCLICRRDLIFSPEGPVERPPIPPPVAVLHCGHTFHDHCLQKITPEDQSKCPPCIPCAIGEN